jgi:4,5-DOPA dioxygenase extradiol
VSHGSPTLAIEPEAKSAGFLSALGPDLGPSAILCVTAHWETRGGFAVNSGPNPGMIYDFGGFPEDLYRIVYPGPGAPDVAGRALERVR